MELMAPIGIVEIGIVDGGGKCAIATTAINRRCSRR